MSTAMASFLGMGHTAQAPWPETTSGPVADSRDAAAAALK
jgi:hypothetical protein